MVALLRSDRIASTAQKSVVLAVLAGVIGPAIAFLLALNLHRFVNEGPLTEPLGMGLLIAGIKLGPAFFVTLYTGAWRRLIPIVLVCELINITLTVASWLTGVNFMPNILVSQVISLYLAANVIFEARRALRRASDRAAEGPIT